MRDCDHAVCAAYDSCQFGSYYERRDDFWFRRQAGLPTDQLGTDPLAWLDGDIPR
jgi:hypothetical protein